jgi:hypothetical protein
MVLASVTTMVFAFSSFAHNIDWLLPTLGFPIKKYIE